jgi:cysteine desulfurase/selenocysteine lyase
MDIRREFPLRPGLIYLNHAAVAPWPTRTAEAIDRFARESVKQGAVGYPAWVKVETELRERLRTLINAPSTDDIALLKNTSEALSTVAYGLAWRPGDNVVTTNQEFPSNRIPWQSLARFGVEVRQAAIDREASPEDGLMAATDRRTRLLTVSSVQYGSGLRLDLSRLGAFCRERGILFCVDAIQSLGALAFDAQAVAADFVAADGHKWMLGPEGLAVFYSRPEARDRLQLTQFGWHMVAEPGDYERQDWREAPNARRFECGSPNMLGIHGLNASLSLLLEVGMAEVERAVLANARYLMAAIAGHSGLELVTPSSPGHYGGIVSFRPRSRDAAALHRHLTMAGVVCALRSGSVRFSPHFYTPQQHLHQALIEVKEFL